MSVPQDGDRPPQGGGQTADDGLGLHPTKLKVLKAVAQLSAAGGKVPSSTVRETVGLSQQLLNRHLHDLAEAGLVQKEHPGPGLPLEVRATPLGYQAAGVARPAPPTKSQAAAVAQPRPVQRLPQPRAQVQVRPTPTARPQAQAQAPAPAPAQPGSPAQARPPVRPTPTAQAQAPAQPGSPAQARPPVRPTPTARPQAQAQAPPRPRPRPQAPPPAVSHKGQTRLQRQSQALYEKMAPHLVGLDQEGFHRLVAQAVAQAFKSNLYQVLTPHLRGFIDDRRILQILGIEQREMIGYGEDGPGGPRTEAFAQHEPPAKPPQLSPQELDLERGLQATANQMHRDKAWHLRTREFIAEWGWSRRRQGVPGSYFRSFEPLWKHWEWRDFNDARRQADAHGAVYRDWIKAQFDDRIQGENLVEVPPRDLHGEKASQIYRRWLQESDDQQLGPGLGRPPYSRGEFDLGNQAHTDFADKVLREIMRLARHTVGDEKDQVARLLAQAIRKGVLPQAALELRPQLKKDTLEALARLSGEGESQPHTII